MTNFINIVLHEPEIPQNTGNIARLCACTGARLILVGKLGFSMTSKYVKHSGLDYWDKVDIVRYVDYNEFLNSVDGGNIYYLTTKGKKSLFEAKFKAGDYLVFGSESKGLPSWIMDLDRESHLRLPMREKTRSLNLANTVAITTYEAIRQIEPELQ